MFFSKYGIKSTYSRALFEQEQGGEQGGAGGEPNGAGGEPNGAGGEHYQLSPERAVELKTKFTDGEGNLDINSMLSQLDKFESSAVAPESYSNDFFNSDETLKSYEVSEDDPILIAASSWAKENGVPQDKYEQLIKGAMGEIIKTNQALAEQEEARIKELWDKIPDNESRRANAQAVLSNILGEDLKASVEQLVNHPVVFPVLDALLSKVRDPKINADHYQPAPALSRQELQTLRVERDKAESEGNKSLAAQIQSKIDKGYQALEKSGKL